MNATTTMMMMMMLMIAMVGAFNSQEYIPVWAGGRCKQFPYCCTDNMSPFFRATPTTCDMEGDQAGIQIGYQHQKANPKPVGTHARGTASNRYVLAAHVDANGVAGPLSYEQAHELCATYKTSGGVTKPTTLATVTNDPSGTKRGQYKELIQACYNKTRRDELASAKKAGATGNINPGCWLGIYRVGCKKTKPQAEQGQFVWTGHGGCSNAGSNVNCLAARDFLKDELYMVSKVANPGFNQNCVATRHFTCDDATDENCRTHPSKGLPGFDAADFLTKDKSLLPNGLFQSVNCAINIPYAVKYVVCDNPDYWGTTKDISSCMQPQPTYTPIPNPLTMNPYSAKCCSTEKGDWTLHFNDCGGAGGASVQVVPCTATGANYMTHFTSFDGVIVEFEGKKFDFYHIEGTWGTGSSTANTFTGALKLWDPAGTLQSRDQITISIVVSMNSGLDHDIDGPGKFVKNKFTVPMGAYTFNVLISQFDFTPSSGSAAFVKWYMVTTQQMRHFNGVFNIIEYGYKGVPDQYEVFATTCRSKDKQVGIINGITSPSINLPRKTVDPYVFDYNFDAHFYKESVKYNDHSQLAHMPLGDSSCWSQNPELFVKNNGYQGSVANTQFPGGLSWRFFVNWQSDVVPRVHVGTNKRFKLKMEAISTPHVVRHKPYGAVIGYYFDPPGNSLDVTKTHTVELFGMVSYQPEKCARISGVAKCDDCTAMWKVKAPFKGEESESATEKILKSFGMPVTAGTVIGLTIGIVAVVAINVAFICYCCTKRIKMKQQFAHERLGDGNEQ